MKPVATSIKILHFADLHLSAANREKKQYSLEVLRGIFKHAREANCILICGDLFDTYQDITHFTEEFCELSNHNQVPIYYIPGNHEELRQEPSDPYSKFSSPYLHIMKTKPYSFIECECGDVVLELLCIPHQDQYSDFLSWNIPPKTESNLRIALSHGIVSGLRYTGPNDEEGGSYLSQGLFSHYEVDYAALGHLHQKSCDKIGNCTFVYPGSSRVWRKGEDGARNVALIECLASSSSVNPTMNIEFVAIEEAGRYRQVPILLNVDGQARNEYELHDLHKNDYIEFVCSGIVENEMQMKQFEEKLREKYEQQVRKLRIIDNVNYFNNIKEEKIVQRFLGIWQKQYDEARETEKEHVFYALQVFLNKLNDIKKTK